MIVTCEMHFIVTTHDADHASLAAHADEVMNQLLALEASDPAITDSAIGLDSNSMTAVISVAVEAVSLEQAVGVARSAIRTAIHAAGGATPDWDAPSAGGSVPFEVTMQDLRVTPVAA